VTVDPFDERLAKVRQRFVSTLESKIEDSYAALPNLCGEAAAVGETYRRIHGIVGVGSTLGFAATGRSARDAENVLLPAHRAGRGLNAQEIEALRNVLLALREVAQRELKTIRSSQ
jgi:chemotaxis protein histidine kinase CheA